MFCEDKYSDSALINPSDCVIIFPISVFRIIFERVVFMKTNKAVIVILASVVLLSSILSACTSGGDSKKQDSTSKNVSDTVVSAEESEEVSETSHQDESSSDVTSEISAESSDEGSSEPEESSQESSEESIEESSAESSEEVSEQSYVQEYVFEDDTSEKDYQDPHHFTDNDEFNRLFEENETDKQYKLDAMECETIMDMRNLAQDYGNKWKAQEGASYEKLYVLLEEYPTEREKLYESEMNWKASVGEAEERFREAFESDGSAGLLEVDASMLNYYKYRAAFLYLQIYKLTGSFSPEI